MQSHTHALTHYGQFREVTQPTTHDFGLQEDTGEPERKSTEEQEDQANSTHTGGNKHRNQ